MTMHAAGSLLARILLSSIFLVSGIPKLFAYQQAINSLAAYGIPSFALPIIIALEIGCGLAVLTGLFARTAALLLATLALTTAAVFHRHIGEDAELVNFMKNVAIAGGLILLAVNGPGAWALRLGRSKPKSGPDAKGPPKIKLVPSTADALTRYRSNRR